MVNRLASFFAVSRRAVHRWKAVGADITNAPRLLDFLRGQINPAPGVADRLVETDVEEALAAFLANSSAPLPTPPPYNPSRERLRALRALKTTKQVELLQIRIGVAKGELMRRTESRDHGARTAAEFVAALTALENDAPGVIAGLGADAIASYLRPRLEAIGARFLARVEEI
jgi:hypothetical protein